MQSLLERGLVDELHLIVFPIVLGGGKRLFADGAAQTAWRLVEARQSAAVALLTLVRKR